MYVVTGATGNTGRIVAKKLLAGGQKVRAIGRNADRLRAIVKDRYRQALDFMDSNVCNHAPAAREATLISSGGMTRAARQVPYPTKIPHTVP